MNTIYTGAGNRTVSVTTNELAGASASWKTLTGLPNRSISKISVMPDNRQDVYVTVSGFGAGHVFHSTNGGTSWTDISGDLPDTPTNNILHPPRSKRQESDLSRDRYRRIRHRQWLASVGRPSGKDCPTSWFRNLLIYLPTRTLRVITHGRGAWQTAIPLIACSQSTSSFTFANQLRGTTSPAQVVTSSTTSSRAALPRSRSQALYANQ